LKPFRKIVGKVNFGKMPPSTGSRLDLRQGFNYAQTPRNATTIFQPAVQSFGGIADGLLFALNQRK
jgi:hypothetical protein